MDVRSLLLLVFSGFVAQCLLLAMYIQTRIAIVCNVLRRENGMTIVTFRLDERLKSKMKRFRHVNWSEVIRAAIAERISLEESIATRRSIDVDPLRKAIGDQDRLRAKTSGVWSGAEEVRKWREFRM